MYRALTHGKVKGWSGEQYVFLKGQLVDAPNGDLWNYPCVEWEGDKPEKKQEFETGVEIIYPNSP